MSVRSRMMIGMSTCGQVCDRVKGDDCAGLCVRGCVHENVHGYVCMYVCMHRDESMCPLDHGRGLRKHSPPSERRPAQRGTSGPCPATMKMRTRVKIRTS